MKLLPLIVATLTTTLTLTSCAGTGTSNSTSNTTNKTVSTQLSEKSTTQDIANALTGTWVGCMEDGDNSSYSIEMRYTPKNNGEMLGEFSGIAPFYNKPNCQGEQTKVRDAKAALLTLTPYHNYLDEEVLEYTKILHHYFPDTKNQKLILAKVRFQDADEEQILIITANGLYMAADKFAVKKVK